MFIKAKLSWDVTIPAEDMDTNLNRHLLQRSILICLFDDFDTKKATKNLGYLVTIKDLENTGQGRINEHTGGIRFPVVFSGISFKMFKGEVLHGVVHKVHKSGVFLRSGPYENIYLSHLKMPGYKYIPGENPFFVDQNMTGVRIDSKVRFIVLDTKWKEAEREREFAVVASIEGDNLGPF